MSRPAPTADALARLGVRRCLLAIHDSAFPSRPNEPWYRGSRTTGGARDLMAFASALGFDGLQLGPVGLTSRDNPSPYDGAAFSRNPLDVDVYALGLEIEVASGDPQRVRYGEAWRRSREVLDEARARDPRRADVEAFIEGEGAWLVPDAIYDALSQAAGGRAHFDWPRPVEATAAQGLRAQHAEAVERYAYAQLLVAEQHAVARDHARGLGLRLYGDLQVGLSQRDRWRFHRSFLAGYHMGAPPSRTNPAGQPWGYPVFDPAQLDGAAGDLVVARLERAFADFDGLRVDHPHGLVCPWVYRSGTADPMAAVRAGARLYSAPDLADHAGLATHAISRSDQLDRSLPRHHDGWVRALDDAQVERYARLLDRLMVIAERAGAEAEDVVVELLSTCPRPLGEAMRRHGLGRFRVTQKEVLDDPADVYRSENAAPADWVMLGTHDTPPIWLRAREWEAAGQLPAHAARLAELLASAQIDCATLEAQLANDRHALVQARFAALFASPARQLMVFFADLFGIEAIYNRAGEAHPENWTLRLGADFAETYEERRGRGAALDFPRALALALRSRGLGDAELLGALDAESGGPPLGVKNPSPDPGR